MVEGEQYAHEFYKHCDEKDADAISWAFVNKEKMVRFPVMKSQPLPQVQTKCK